MHPGCRDYSYAICILTGNMFVFAKNNNNNNNKNCFKEKDIVPITKIQLSLLSPLPFPRRWPWSWRCHPRAWHLNAFFTQPCPVNNIPACVPFYRHAHQAPSQAHLLRMSYLKKKFFFNWSIVALQRCVVFDSKNSTTIWPGNPTTGHIFRENHNLYPSVHSSSVCNSQNTEAT